ncbi:hypothetical protein ACE1SV_65460 [Streptomyces sennicomposti]
MVIISPAMPSETVKLAPTSVRSPMGRISVVTMEKMPSITATTASHRIAGERCGESVPPVSRGVAVVDAAMDSIP